MDVIKGLGELTPSALMVVALLVIAKYIVAPILKTHQTATKELADSLRTSAAQFKEALDGTSAAVRESVDHNEKIITNHLSKEEARDQVILLEMKSVAEAIDKMNHRRRETDGNG